MNKTQAAPLLRPNETGDRIGEWVAETEFDRNVCVETADEVGGDFAQRESLNESLRTVHCQAPWWPLVRVDATRRYQIDLVEVDAGKLRWDVQIRFDHVEVSIVSVVVLLEFNAAQLQFDALQTGRVKKCRIVAVYIAAA